MVNEKGARLKIPSCSTLQSTFCNLKYLWFLPLLLPTLLCKLVVILSYWHCQLHTNNQTHIVPIYVIVYLIYSVTALFPFSDFIPVPALVHHADANRPFATKDHMVQNPSCWRASSLLFPQWDIKTKASQA